jgi:ADP-ribose pyrophosphatase YjhB (NUDIX family)
MEDDVSPRWLQWAREIQSLAQIGLTFSDNEHQRENFRRLQEIAAEMVQDRTGRDKGELMEIFASQPGYATAKVDVRGACLRGDRILLVRERVDGRWCMPGGWADVGEYPSDMVAREVLEESGFRVRPRKVVGIYDANRGGRPLEFFHAYKLVFLCDILDGSPQTSLETVDVGFFRFDDLPELSTNRTDRRHLREVLAHARDPGRPAAFD